MKADSFNDGSDQEPAVSIPYGTKAMIFAAGLGTRLKPFTDRHPKALAPVNGKPLLQRNIEYMLSYGVRDIIVNVHHFAGQIISFLNEHNGFGANITISDEQPSPLETGGGLLKAAWFFAGDHKPFFVMNADILTDLNLNGLYRSHLASNPIATLAVTKRKSSRVLLFDEDMHLSGWKNLSTGDTRIAREGIQPLLPYAFTCVHLLEPSMLGMIRQQGAFSIIDTYLDLARSSEIHGYNHDGDRVVDVGRPESVSEAEQLFA